MTTPETAFGRLPLKGGTTSGPAKPDPRWLLGNARYLSRVSKVATALPFGLSVPFGFTTNGESYLGSVVWTADEIDMADVLTQCDRFCDHPTFDSAGVYQVQDPFRSTYMNRCYLPDYPVLGDGGFPPDP